MAKRVEASQLLKLTDEIEQSLQCPIIFFTRTDFADNVYTVLINVSRSVLDGAPPETVLEMIKKFHYEWLLAVKKLEHFRKRLKTIPRESILRTIDFTIKSLEHRYAFLNTYYKEMEVFLTSEEHELMAANMDIIAELRQIHHNTLLEKQDRFLNEEDQKEYLNQIYDEIEQLLTWLDWQYDNLAVQCIEAVNLKVPIVPSDLAKVLKQLVEEISQVGDSESQRITSLITLKSKTSQVIPIRSLQELEITRLIIKIKALEDRISKLEESSALMALQNRATYLKGKVDSLLNMQQSLTRQPDEFTIDDQIDDRIFNHTLLPSDRMRLIDRLVDIWDKAMNIQSHDSIISILSVADIKEVFSDSMGQFTVDKYGRKIYNKNNELYQLNEKNELVLVRDDEDRPYFYDDCGRYYLNLKSQRIYKAHANASEYLLNSAGMLLKIKEVINGIEYFYDCLGRYYINEHGQPIYRDKGKESEYEFDGISNLVKISKTKYCHAPYVKKPLTIEENKYLQQTVGLALKKCIANVILHRPTDPIAYLADSLVKYKLNMDEQQQHCDDEKERLATAEFYSTKQNNSPQIMEFDQDSYEMTYHIQEGEF